MKILLYGLNYAPEITGVGKYSGQLGSWLQSQGNEVKVISAPPYYPSWKILDGYKNWFVREKIDDVDVRRCPLYVPSKPTTVKRLLHLLSFVFSSSFSLIRLIWWRPNVVINVVPAFFTAFTSWIYCSLTGAKFVIHIQDFESDALFSLSANKKRSFFENVWLKVERFLLSKADCVSTISHAMIDNAVSKGVSASKTCYFPNWSEVTMFQNVQNVLPFKKALLGEKEGKVVLYSGNMGRKQGLELVADCALESQNNNDGLIYVLCGEGSGKRDLIQLKERYNLKNMFFFPLQPYSDFPRLLAMADVHLVIQKPGVANAVLPSKLTNILAVGGNAVITTNEDTEIGRLIEKNPGIAISVIPENFEALLYGIKLASKQKKVNNIAMAYAEKHLAKEAILKQFEINLIELVAERKGAI